MCFVRNAALGCWWLWRLWNTFPRILLKSGISVLSVRGKWASIAWELSCTGETWRPSTGFSGWGRNIPPLGVHQTGTFPKFQLHTGKSSLSISSSDRRIKNLPCFLPGLEHFLRKLWMPEPLGCVLKGHQVGQGSHSMLQVAFPWMLFQHGPGIPYGHQALQTFSGQIFFPLCRCFVTGNFLLNVSGTWENSLQMLQWPLNPGSNALSTWLGTSLSYPWIFKPKYLSLLLLPQLSVFTIFCSLHSLIFHLMKTIPVFTPGCNSRVVLGGCDCFSDLLGVSVLVYGLNIQVCFSIFSFLCLFHSWSLVPSSSSPRTF